MDAYVSPPCSLGAREAAPGAADRRGVPSSSMAALQPLLPLPTPALRTLLEEGGLQPGVSTEDVSSPAEWLVDPFECAVALTYDASMAAIARRGTIVLCRREPAGDGGAERWRVSNPIVSSAALGLAADVTALVWLRPHVPEHTVGGPFLAAGTSTGHLLIYGRDGRVVLKQLIDNDPILHIKFRPVSQHSGSDGSSDISLRFPRKLVHIDGADVCALLARQQSDYGTIKEQGPAYLPHRKWDLRDQTLTTDVVCCGRMPARLAEILPAHAPPYQLLAAGKDPCLAVYAGHGQPSIFPGLGSLAAKGVAAVANLAKSFWSWDPEPEATGSSEDEPPPLERAVGVRPADGGALHDPTRRLERLELDPAARLVAGTDAFGRVMLIDVAAYPPVITRLWKGYREAQIVWVHQEEPGAATQLSSVPAALLAIYLPRRGLLEVWPASAGDRLAALSVGKELRLISATSGRLGVERGGDAGEAALPRQPSSGLRPWFACQCLLIAADGSLSNLVVEAVDTQPPIQVPVPCESAETIGIPRAVPNLDDSAKEQVVYRDFLHHVASGDGEDVLLKAIASINGPQALLSALKAIAESQPSHSRLNWKAASVAAVELEFAHKRNPSSTGMQLLHALNRRECLLRAYCVLSGETDTEDAMVLPPAVSSVTHLWAVDRLRSERRWLLKYSTDVAADMDGLTHAAAVNCIAFLRCFPPIQDTTGGIVESADASRLVARVLFNPLVNQGDNAMGDDELAVQRVRSAVALLDLSPTEVWRLFAEWFIQQPLVGRPGNESGTLFGKVDSRTAGRKVVWYLNCLGAEGSGSAVQICQQSPRLGHVLVLVATCAAMNLEPHSDGESWDSLLDKAQGAWELHKLLALVARHISLPIEGYNHTTSLTRLTAMLQLQLGNERYTAHGDVDDNYLRRIEPGSPLARRAAFTTICRLFPRHTVPSMLDMHAAVVLSSQWGGFWANHVALTSACDLLEKLGERAVPGVALNPLQLANAQAVGAMLIWQRFCRDVMCRLLNALEIGNGFPVDAATDVTAVQENLATFGRIVALFDPVRIAERKLSLGTDVHNIMRKLDDALSEAPLIDPASDGASDTVESNSHTNADSTKAQAFEAFGLSIADQQPSSAWLPIDIPDEFMGATDFSAAAARVSACDCRLHTEYCILLQTLAAMAAHNITDPKPSAMFRCQYIREDSGTPFAPLDGTEKEDSPRTSNERYARERLVHRLIGSNDLSRALALASLFGHDCEKVRVQWILRAYEMATEGDLEQEVIDSIDDRYKLGVGLLTVARQRLARVLLAAQDRMEEQAAAERLRAETGRQDSGRSRPAMLSKTEKQENELLRLMQSKLAQKQVRACILCLPLICACMLGGPR